MNINANMMYENKATELVALCYDIILTFLYI